MKQIPASIKGMSAFGLKEVINRAVEVNSLPEDRRAPKTNSKDELISHIDELCNEFGLTVGVDGQLVKAQAADERERLFQDRVQEWTGPGVTAQNLTDLVFAFSVDTGLWEDFQRWVRESTAAHVAEMNANA